MKNILRWMMRFSVGVVPLAGAGSPGSKAELLQTEAAFCARVREAGLVTAFAEFAAADAVFFDVDPAQHRGAEAVRMRFEGLDPTAVLSWTPVAADVADSGELGYTWGTYEFRVQGKEGQERIGTGHYVSIWKRQSDGCWKFVLDTGNPSPPAQPKTSIATTP